MQPTSWVSKKAVENALYNHVTSLVQPLSQVPRGGHYGQVSLYVSLPNAVDPHISGPYISAWLPGLIIQTPLGYYS